jgi:hypothetical protein
MVIDCGILLQPSALFSFFALKCRISEIFELELLKQKQIFKLRCSVFLDYVNTNLSRKYPAVFWPLGRAQGPLHNVSA